jgi:RNA polymerase sigma-70 factor, ECF subfamily
MPLTEPEERPARRTRVGCKSMDIADAEVLLRRAQLGRSEPLGQLLELHRNDLTVLATAQLDRRLRGRMSPADLVQDAMLAAHRDFAKFHGTSEREFRAWLRKILIRCLYHSIEKHLKSKRRDVRCEVPLEQIGMRSQRARLDGQTFDLVDHGGALADVAHQREELGTFTHRLASLKPQYRRVIVLRLVHGLSFDEVARRMNRNPTAARMLWLRAIEKLRRFYSGKD